MVLYFIKTIKGHIIITNILYLQKIFMVLCPNNPPQKNLTRSFFSFSFLVLRTELIQIVPSPLFSNRGGKGEGGLCVRDTLPNKWTEIFCLLLNISQSSLISSIYYLTPEGGHYPTYVGCLLPVKNKEDTIPAHCF